jgi:hypothetical protein
MVSLPALEALLHTMYVGEPTASLREEERKKARELEVLLAEMDRIAPRTGTLVDAAAGKGALGIAAIATILPAWKLVSLEIDARRVGLLEHAARRAGITVEARAADVAAVEAWPTDPTLVVALHACGRATDAVLERAAAAGARHLLLVPCCYGGFAIHPDAARPTDDAVHGWAERIGFPSQGLVRASLARALVDAERTLRLEALGYETVVVDAIPASVTPFGRLWRARRVRERVRMARSAALLERLQSGGR